MDAKYRGEQAVRASGTPYTIIRPGGLLPGSATAARAGVVFGQGDAPVPLGGRDVSRRDVAAVVIDAIAAGPRNVTCEVVAAVARDGGASTTDAMVTRLRELRPDAV
jgi:uncharacterized protein YbjT (DUF2867 family)